MIIEDLFFTFIARLMIALILIMFVILGFKGYIKYQQHVYCKKQEAKPYFACMMYRGKLDIGNGQEDF